MADMHNRECEATRPASRDRSRSPRLGHAAAAEMFQPYASQAVLNTVAGMGEQLDQFTRLAADDLPEEECSGPEESYDDYETRMQQDYYEQQENDYEAQRQHELAEKAEANPFAWQREHATLQHDGSTRTMVAHKAVSGDRICELSGLGPNTCGKQLHSVIAQADGIHPTEKRIIIDTDEIAVYDRLKQFKPSTHELTVFYEPLVTRLGAPDPATRLKAVWAAAEANDEDIENFMGAQAAHVCEGLVNGLRSSRTREVSGALRAIRRILEVGYKDVPEDLDLFDTDNRFVEAMEAGGVVDALQSLLTGHIQEVCDAAWDLLHDHFGEDSYAGGMTPDAITD